MGCSAGHNRRLPAVEGVSISTLLPDLVLSLPTLHAAAGLCYCLSQEAKDRDWRAKEQAAAARQAAMMTDLAAAREAQMRRKLMAQAAMAEVEQTEFKRVLEVNREKQLQDMSQVGVAQFSESSNAVVTEAWGS